MDEHPNNPVTLTNQTPNNKVLMTRSSDQMLRPLRARPRGGGSQEVGGPQAARAALLARFAVIAAFPRQPDPAAHFACFFRRVGLAFLSRQNSSSLPFPRYPLLFPHGHGGASLWVSMSVPPFLTHSLTFFIFLSVPMHSFSSSWCYYS